MKIAGEVKSVGLSTCTYWLSTAAVVGLLHGLRPRSLTNPARFSALLPKLICQPGGTCGTVEYFYLQAYDPVILKMYAYRSP